MVTKEDTLLINAVRQAQIESRMRGWPEHAKRYDVIWLPEDLIKWMKENDGQASFLFEDDKYGLEIWHQWAAVWPNNHDKPIQVHISVLRETYARGLIQRVRGEPSWFYVVETKGA